MFKAMHGCSEPGEMFSVQRNVWMLDIDQAKQCLDVRNQVGSSVFKCSEPGEMFSVQRNVWMLDKDQAKQCMDVRNQVKCSVFKEMYGCSI